MGILFAPVGQIFITPVAMAAKVINGVTISDTCLDSPRGAACTAQENAAIDSQDGVRGTDSAAQAAAKQVANKTPATTDPFACGLLNPSACLSNVVYAFTVGLGSGLAYVSSFMFDTTVSLSLNSAAYALTFLSSGWTAARDLSNMAFILILVYIAFMIMFEAETAGTIKMLAWVIFIALIINFSFFFTRVVIDVGNILAVQFYNSIQAPSLQETMNKATNKSPGVMAKTAAGIATAAAPQGSLANTKDLTDSIMQALNIQELFSNPSFTAFRKQTGFGSEFIILSFLYIMVGACYFILAAMFFAVAIKFVVRVVVLWFLIIASPLAFICKAVPNRTDISGLYDRWQHELVVHAFYPAFFLFIFFFISTIMKSFGGMNGKGGILDGLAESLNTAASDPNMSGFIFIASAVANVGIRLGFVVAMLYIALKASEHMGVKGGEIAHQVTSYAFGQTGRLASMPGRIIGQNTLGRAGNALANNKYLATRAATGSNLLTKGVWKGLDRTSKATGTALGTASYDLRNAPGTSILKKGIEKISGSAVSAGEPAKGGYIAQAKERADQLKKEKAEEAVILRDVENKKMMKELIEKTEKQDALEATSKTRALTTAEDTQKKVLKIEVGKLANKLNGLNKREMETFKLADIEKVIHHAKEGTIKKIEESDKHTEKDKEDIREKWSAKMGDTALNKSQDIVKELRQLHTDLSTRGGITLAALAHATTAGNTVDTATLKSALNEIKTEMAKTKARSNLARTPADKIREEESLQNLQEVRDQITNLNKERENVPADTGGAPNPKEFLVA